MLPANITELDTIKKECIRMSNKKALLSAAASAVPVPFTDIAADVILLKQIIPGISEKFGMSKEQIDEYNPQLAIFIYDIAKRLGTNMVCKYVTKELIVQILKKMGVRLTARQIARYVPVLGQMASAGIGFVGMKMIIRSHINECYAVVKTVIESKNSI